MVSRGWTIWPEKSVPAQLGLSWTSLGPVLGLSWLLPGLSGLWASLGSACRFSAAVWLEAINEEIREHSLIHSSRPLSFISLRGPRKTGCNFNQNCSHPVCQHPGVPVSLGFGVLVSRCSGWCLGVPVYRCFTTCFQTVFSVLTYRLLWVRAVLVQFVWILFCHCFCNVFMLWAHCIDLLSKSFLGIVWRFLSVQYWCSSS